MFLLFGMLENKLQHSLKVSELQYYLFSSITFVTSCFEHGIKGLIVE